MTTKNKNCLDEPHFGELGLHLLKIHFAERRFGLPAHPDPATLAERAFRLSVEFHPEDLALLSSAYAHRADAAWVEYDQVAHLYNVICRRLLYVAPGPHTRKPVLFASCVPPVSPFVEGASVQVKGVLVFGDGNCERLVYNMARLVETHPLHRSTLISSMSLSPIGNGSIADAVHEIIAPAMMKIPGASLRVFDRPAARQISQEVAAAAAQMRRHRLKEDRHLRAEVDPLGARSDRGSRLIPPQLSFTDPYNEQGSFRRGRPRSN